MTPLLLIKAQVRGHTRRAAGGAPVFVRPYVTSTRAAQPDLFGRPASPPPSPPGRVIFASGEDRAIAGMAELAEELRRRLLPSHTISLRTTHDSRTVAGNITAADPDFIYYGGKEGVAPARTGNPDMTITINTSDTEGRRRSDAAILNTLLHEMGHAFYLGRFFDAPEGQREAIRAQWRRETRRADPRSEPPGAPIPSAIGHRDFADASKTRRWFLSGLTEQQLRAGSLEASLGGPADYNRLLEEWFAERFADWVTHRTTDGPIAAFFQAGAEVLREAWRMAMRLLGMTTRDAGVSIQRFIEDAWEGGRPIIVRPHRTARPAPRTAPPQATLPNL